MAQHFDSKVRAQSMGPALGFTFNAMRNTTKQRERVGKPIPFGERPADRPMAEHLGTGKSFAAIEKGAGRVHAEGSSKSDAPTYYGLTRVTSSTMFRDKAGMKRFSWEQDA